MSCKETGWYEVDLKSIRIIGAGSIGNHIAHAARCRGWDVMLTDIDEAALRRTKEEIYPGRYGRWDPAIQLANSWDTVGESADVVLIGTPPDTHITLARETLDRASVNALIIEKPLCGPDLEGCMELWNQVEQSGVFVGVGYNHTLARNTQKMDTLIEINSWGEVETLSAKTREHWGGVFQAHPWLRGPEETYLGFSSRGGGACGEHSHAINIWQHFANSLGAGRVIEVNAVLNIRQKGASDYDQLAILALRTETGLVGEVIQDVVTFPTEKMARLQWENGYAEWHVNYEKDVDAIVSGEKTGTPTIEKFPKTRVDDFKLEIEHIERILDDDVTDSVISLGRGLDTMMVIAAAFVSASQKRTVHIDWNAGYRPEAIQ